MRLRNSLAILVLFLLTTQTALAQEAIANQEHTIPVTPVIKLKGAADNYNFVLPNQKIDASATVEPGEVVVVKASTIEVMPEYLVGVSYRWAVFVHGKVNKNVNTMPDNSGAFFGAGVKPGKKFTVVLSASYLYVVKDAKDVSKVLAIGQRSALLTTEIVVTGEPEPEPTPNPNPPPTPTPVVLPDGKYKLAKSAYDLVMANVVNSANRAKAAKALASSFQGQAAAVSAGTVKTSKDLLAQTQASNRTALTNAGVPTAEWETFFARLQPVIYDLYNRNQMATLTDFATAWNEIAVGLNAVR
jgi:hypothetical protein